MSYYLKPQVRICLISLIHFISLLVCAFRSVHQRTIFGWCKMGQKDQKTGRIHTKGFTRYFPSGEFRIVHFEAFLTQNILLI